MASKKNFFLQILILRGGAVVARWAHNPKVVGSSPAPATLKNPRLIENNLGFFLKKIIFVRF